MRIRKINKQKNGLERFLFFTLLALFFSLGAQAQVSVVQGTVLGEDDGMPIPGVTIVVRGQTKGTTTDFDGKYSIKAKEGDILSFSYIGMTTNNLKVKGNTLNVKLKSATQDLKEVIVIGYGKVTKKELTGAVASIKATDIENQVTSDLGNALQGQISGVNVISSSEPGGTSEILIRGVSSISNNSGPLYVVDGIAQVGDPGLNPNEIETIDVLKDAASAAIYGSRGAGGVILITTKKGKAGSMVVRFNGSYGIERISGNQVPLLNANDQGYVDVLYNRNQGLNDDLILGTYRNKSAYQNDTNLLNAIFVDNAATQNYSLNLSGGTNNLTYSVSTGLYNKTGVIKNTDFNRFNTRANATYTKDKLTATISVAMIKEKNNTGASGAVSQILRYFPTQDALDPDAVLQDLETAGGEDSNRLSWVLGSINFKDQRETTRANATFNFNYKLFDGLSVTARVGLNDSNNYNTQFRESHDIFNIQTGLTQSDALTASFVLNEAARYTNTTFDGILNYNKSLLKSHNFGLTLAVSKEEREFKSFFARKSGVVNNNFEVLNTATGIPSVGNGFNTTSQLLGIIGRFQYDYKGKYILSSSIRRDASSRFAENNRVGVFPSVSAAWNISDEGFFKGFTSVVNNFKLRASSGSVGNDNVRDYSYSSPISRLIDYANPDGTISSGATQVTFGNPSLKWETSKQNNIGIDLGFFKNKLTLTADYYQTKTEDLLFNVSTPGSAGTTTTDNASNNRVAFNIGEMTNKGFELAVGYRNNIGKLYFNMNGTFSTNENRVTKIASTAPFILTEDNGIVSGARNESQITAISQGHEVASFFLYETNGLVTPENIAEYQLIVPGAKLGDLRYVNNDLTETNGKQVIDERDRVYKGSGLAKYEVGYNLKLNYKNFDLYTQLYAAVGHEIMNGAKATAYGNLRHQDLLYSWSNANTETTIPANRGDLKASRNYRADSDLFVEDGSYLRIRNITLGYNLSKNAIKSLGVTKCRFYLTGQNLFTFTNYTGFDPQVGGGANARGLDKGNYPLAKMYLAGLSLDF